MLTEVGDEDVIEQLDIGPDSAHGPGTSASMLAGPVSDTVGHSEGERVTVSKGASKAAQVDKANLPRKPSERATAKSTGKSSTAKPRGGRK